MSRIGSKRVDPEGSTDAKIMVVGEAPGGQEEDFGRPFVGPAGNLLERYLRRHGISRNEVYLTNLGKYRPASNSFMHYVRAPEVLERSLNELTEEISTVNPNVIIAAGSWPLFYLTGRHTGKNNIPKKPIAGIEKFRGSILPLSLNELKREDGLPYKVIPTIHPSAVNRNWDYNPFFYFDLQRAVADAEFPELRYPEYESIIDPPLDRLESLCNECRESAWTSLDIENFPGRYSCIGFTDRLDRGIVLTCLHPQLALAEQIVKGMWESDNPKILQYGIHDSLFMEKFYGWKLGGYYNNQGWDTYTAMANLQPEFPKGLDFMASIYTRFPYYKPERKEWKEKDDIQMLWEYNVKDIIITLDVGLQQMKEMEELYGFAA